MKKIISKRLLCLSLALIIALSFVVPTFAEDAEYETFKISNGYGMAAKAGVLVTKGATAKIKVDIKVNCVNENTIKEFIRTNESFFSKEEYSTITQSKEYKNKGFGASLWWKILGVCFKKNNGSYNYFKNAVNKEVVVDNSKEEYFFNQMKEINETSARVTGTLTAVGQSLIPTQACAYIEVSKVTFEDGTTLRVLDTADPVVADQNGNTDNVTGDGTINILFD
jgi:hypothetical protein